MLSHDQKLKLQRAGFTPYEIRRIDEAKTPDGKPQKAVLSDGPWQDAMANRFAYVRRLRQKGWKPVEIARAINSYYRKYKKASPFDFLKLEYKPPKKLTDYRSSLTFRKSRARVTRKFGYGYARIRG